MEPTNDARLTGAPKQLSQMERAFGLANTSKQALTDSISLLEERLKPILRSPNPSTAGECEKEEEFVVVAEAVKKLGREFEFANSRIRSILDRLEI